MPIVNNTVLYTLKFVRIVDVMLSVLQLKKKVGGERKANLSNDSMSVCVSHLEMPDSFSATCILGVILSLPRE